MLATPKLSKKEEKELIHHIKKNGGQFKGKTILHKNPGLSVLGAIDGLNRNGYHWVKDQPKGKKKKKS